MPRSCRTLGGGVELFSLGNLPSWADSICYKIGNLVHIGVTKNDDTTGKFGSSTLYIPTQYLNESMYGSHLYMGQYSSPSSNQLIDMWGTIFPDHITLEFPTFDMIGEASFRAFSMSFDYLLN